VFNFIQLTQNYLQSRTTFVSGTVVALSATPDSGSTFEGWSGACSGTGTCVITMDANKSVTATFTATQATSGAFDGVWIGTYSGIYTYTSGATWQYTDEQLQVTIQNGIITAQAPIAATSSVNTRVRRLKYTFNLL